jgi:DNA-3-methyladenine glycosylase
MVLSKEWYSKDTITIAKELLGKYLVHESAEGITVGKIVETEAYLGKNDPASHAYKGESKRTIAMFGDPGHAYIYFTYGMYYCFNVTTAEKGVGEAVLIRALEPIEGIELMQSRRQKVTDNIHLCSGPAKLVLAMGITKDLYGHDLTKKPLLIEERENKEFEIITTTRIGISLAKELPLRFYIKGSQFISKK